MKARKRVQLAAALAVVAVAGAYSWRVWGRGSGFTVVRTADRNVVLVTIDTLRADALSAYGGPAQTPNLDRLAQHGARFTFAHAHTVVTLPSHTTILSGLLPPEHGVRDNGGFRVKAGTPTLATRLKAAGFSTGAFVGGFPLTKRFGLTPGFDVYDDQMPEMRGAVDTSMSERPASQVVSRATDWIGRQRTKFFAWVHVYDPHSPYLPPQPYATQYAQQPYFGEVAYVDHELGALFDLLATLPRDTLVIVTADHGESLGEHGELTHGMFAYEGTLHVPLILADIEAAGASATPGTKGLVIGSPVRHVDLAPTVLDAVGMAADAALPGRSLLSVVNDGDRADRPTYFEAVSYNLVRGWAPLRGVLLGAEKFIDLPLPELYDLSADQREANNLVTSRRDRVGVLGNLLRTYDVSPPIRRGQESADTAATLRSLGYVSGSTPAKAVYTEADDPKRLAALDNDLHTATALTEQGRPDEAMAMLRSVIDRRPDTSDAYLALAYAYWRGGEPGPAIDVLEKGLAAGAPDRDIRIRLGLYLAESHVDTRRAIALLQGMSSEDVEALNGLGVAYGDAGRTDAAIRTFQRVLTLDPTNGLAYQNLGALALQQALAAKNPAERSTRLADAERYANAAIEADPALPDAYTTLGVIQSTTGRKANAIESWKHAVELDEEQFNALYNLWYELYAAGRRDEAIAYGRRFVSTAPPAFFGADIAKVQSTLQ